MVAAASELPQRVLSWWARELKAMAPARGLRAAARDAVVLELDEGGGGRLYTAGREAAPHAVQSVREAATKAADRLMEKRRLVLRLPASSVFRRTTTAPARALPDLRRILELEVEQATPFHLADVEFDFLADADANDRGKLIVRQVIAKKSVIDNALGSLGPAAELVARIDAVGAEGVNLLRGGRPQTRRRSALAAVVIGSAIVALVATEARQSRVISVLENQRNALELETADTRAAAANARAAVENASVLNARIESRPSPIAIVAALTRLLPEDAWLTEISAHEGRITVSGFGRSASEIIAAIEASALFAGVETIAPITADATGAYERYSLKFTAVASPSTDAAQPELEKGTQQ